jgi:hypothetical protein
MKRFPNSGTTGTTTGPIQTMGEGRVRLWERTIPVGFAAWEEVVPRSESTEFSKMERTGRDLQWNGQNFAKRQQRENRRTQICK